MSNFQSIQRYTVKIIFHDDKTSKVETFDGLTEDLDNRISELMKDCGFSRIDSQTYMMIESGVDVLMSLCKMSTLMYTYSRFLHRHAMGPSDYFYSVAIYDEDENFVRECIDMMDRFYMNNTIRI